jgi:hypothetical protein
MNTVEIDPAFVAALFFPSKGKTIGYKLAEQLLGIN